ncbi:transketolase [Listeria weihenstephanensis]|uniref:Transketolase n=1 Tax=Listeria weihenstephanensis TaxID=1006155 RepID=A0A841Z5C9_9LIST|nr:transketolase [Listeria weihenstephanensis]MBC1499677.1 transketolase [Listeria weihenstephanensis]
MKKTLDQQTVDTIRTLSIDMIEKANSGHPGMPMGAAPMAYMLWAKNLKFNPTNPNWFNRDRFVLAAGHGSALLYSLTHLFGYDLEISDLKQFRQYESRTPGHPEHGFTAGVDATSGPLGQGIAMAAGMALAESHLAAQYNKSDYPIVDHFTYAICGDGDLMEGVAAETASLAGHLQLEKLIVLYDSNDISLDGDLSVSFSESVQQRFEAYGWEVLRVEDGNDLTEIQAQITQAKRSAKPTLIEVKTVIGYGAPTKSGSSASHGAPLGTDEAAAAKQAYNWNHEPFTVPKEVQEYLENYPKIGADKEAQWNNLIANYTKAYPDLAAEFQRVVKGELSTKWQSEFPTFDGADNKKIATRTASGKMINALATKLPELFGGSADLGCSNKTFIDDSPAYTAKNPSGRNIWFGVREFAMGAMLNGMALHGGLNVFGSTFFVFSDYMRPAIRMAALMKLPVTYVFTHDSIAVGEDGPTHEPIEHLASLRAMPGLSIIRPADAKETRTAWSLAAENKEGPIALILSRQDLPVLSNPQENIDEGVKNGGYTVSPSRQAIPEAVLIATGSEVALALETQQVLQNQYNIDASVVSLPSWDRFAKTAETYQESVLPSAVKARISIEAGATFGWKAFTGTSGLNIGIDHFGDSAPADKLFEAYGLSAPIIAEKTANLLAKEGVQS